MIAQFVIVRSLCIDGWCYAESLNGSKGYTPYLYVVPVFPEADFVPEWQALLSLRESESSQNQTIRLNRKDIVVAQRRSKRKALSTGSFMSEG